MNNIERPIPQKTTNLLDLKETLPLDEFSFDLKIVKLFQKLGLLQINFYIITVKLFLRKKNKICYLVKLKIYVNYFSPSQ